MNGEIGNDSNRAEQCFSLEEIMEWEKEDLESKVFTFHNPADEVIQGEVQRGKFLKFKHKEIVE